MQLYLRQLGLPSTSVQTENRAVTMNKFTNEMDSCDTDASSHLVLYWLELFLVPFKGCSWGCCLFDNHFPLVITGSLIFRWIFSFPLNITHGQTFFPLWNRWSLASTGLWEQPRRHKRGLREGIKLEFIWTKGPVSQHRGTTHQIKHWVKNLSNSTQSNSPVS